MIISESMASSWAQELLSQIATGTAANPKIQIYAGQAPQAISDPITASLLSELELTEAVGSESGGVITFDPISDDPAAAASGIASWGRIINRDGEAVGIFSVGANGSGAELELSSATFAEGLPVSISAAVIQIGG